MSKCCPVTQQPIPIVRDVAWLAKIGGCGCPANLNHKPDAQPRSPWLGVRGGVDAVERWAFVGHGIDQPSGADESLHVAKLVDFKC